MTQLEPTLMVRRMMVFAGGKPVYDQSFHAGVNIIRGENSSGKSTIADFIFFGLGGDVSSWKPEAERCDDVFLEVNVNGVPLTLRRRVSTSPKQPMMVFWGDMEQARKSAADGWQVFSFQRGTIKESFSQVLFRAMGLPEVYSDTESNITLHQLLRLIYVDQLSPVDSLMRTERFDTPMTREVVRDLLFGVYEDSLYRSELRLRNKRRELDQAEIEHKSAMTVLSQAGHELDMNTINGVISETEGRIAKTQDAIRKANEGEAAAATGADQKNNRSLSSALLAVTRERETIQGQIVSLQLDIEDSRQFIMAIEERLIALAESISTRETLGELPLTRCPHCLKPLEQPPSNHVCCLCKQELGEPGGRSHVLRMRQELAFQQKESEALLKQKEGRLSQLRESLPVLVENEQVLQWQYDDAMQATRTSRDRELDALLIQKGTLESQLQFLRVQARAIGVLDSLRTRIKELSSEIGRLEHDIKTKRQIQQDRSGKAIRRIHEIAIELLKADLPREEAFRTARMITVDFRRNSFAVDGRNQFSASSIAYLKNCIHYAIFLASLHLEFFRYPRFIICDNMEDKGMEVERSQNFQRVIVERSDQASTNHQIIFTTSMIDPDLDKSDMCVGPHYDLDHKSLVF